MTIRENNDYSVAEVIAVNPGNTGVRCVSDSQDRPVPEHSMRLRSVVIFALPLLTGACGYNTIQSMDERAASAQKQISVQLQRRADLVPNLVNTVKGFAAQEAEVFETVAKARAGLAGAVSGGNVTDMANANQNLTGALGRL